MRNPRLGRGLAILAVAALAVAVVSPAFSAAPLTKAKVKKIATKVLKNKIDEFGNPIFIQETEFRRFGPIEMQNGAPDVTVGTFGPFTLTARCALSGANLQGSLFIATSEADSTFFSPFWGEEGDFDPTDTDVFWLQDTGTPPGGAAGIHFGGGQMHAAAPSGTSLQGMATLATNFSGSHCVFWGTVTTVAPA
jgi:hypothetical protein